MSQPAKFKCESCNRSYAWKQELAGKKVRCKCGGVVKVPESMDVPEESSELDDLYALAADSPATKAHAAQRGVGRCPDCQGDIETGAVICVSCGFNLKTGARMQTETAAPALAVARPALAGAGAPAGIPRGGARTLGYAGRQPAKDDKAAADAKEEFQALIPPIILAVLGIISMFYYALVPLKLDFVNAVVYVGVSLAVNLVLISVACLAAMKMLDFSLGAPLAALLKLTAVAMLPGTLASLIGYYGGEIGPYIGFVASIFMYYGLLMWFFDLDLGEVIFVEAIIWLVRTWVGYALVGFLLYSMLSGSGGGMGGGGGGSKGAGSGAMSALFGDDPKELTPGGEMNEEAERMIRQEGSTEAKAWAAKSPKHVLMSLSHDDTVKLVQDLYDTGALKVTVVALSPDADRVRADKLVVEVHDAAKRSKVVKFAERMNINPPDDYGKDQKFIIFGINSSSQFGF